MEEYTPPESEKDESEDEEKGEDDAKMNDVEVPEGVRRTGRNRSNKLKLAH